MSLYVDIEKKLHSFSLQVKFQADNEIMALLGASGCGKSMTLKCIAGIEKPDRGRIVLDGQTLYDSEKRINLPPQKRRVGYLFQNYALFPHMTVEQNICAGMGKLGRAEKRAKAAGLIKRFYLEGLEQQHPPRLSGGQQQRVAIARALALKPDILCFDEPTSALDPELTGEVLKVIRSLASQNTTMIIVTHEMAFARDVADQIIFMDEGVIVEQGAARQVIDHPQEERTKQFLVRYTQEAF